jgi:imidazolonepropionase-like amidohydrolase
MKKIIIPLWVAILFVCCSVKDKIPPDMAIVHATVIDATGNKPKHNMTILITNDTITGIKPDNKLKFQSGTKIIDANGKFLIPGLWDMHVHVPDKNLFFPLMIANGVTSMREMFSTREDFKTKLGWRDQINEKKLRAPNIYIPLAVLGPDQKWFGGIEITTKQDAIAFVKEAKEMGADFIKVFDLYDSITFRTLLDEAKKQEIPVAGHCPINFNIADASELGMGCFEHLLGIIFASSSKEDSTRKEIIEKSKQVHESFPDLTRILYFVQSKGIIETYDTIKAEVVFKRLKKSGSFQCPDLVTYYGRLRIMNSDLVDERNKYVPPKILKNWARLETNLFTAKITPDDYDQVKLQINKRFELVSEINKYGIPIIAGTDASWGNQNVIPGFSLHDELSLLVKTGLTPMEALQAATKNAAACMGVSDKTGTIEVGKCADMVLLDANPLENINNTTKINAVIKAGSFISKNELDSLLKKVEETVAMKQ